MEYTDKLLFFYYIHGNVISSLCSVLFTKLCSLSFDNRYLIGRRLLTGKFYPIMFTA